MRAEHHPFLLAALLVVGLGTSGCSSDDGYTRPATGAAPYLLADAPPAAGRPASGVGEAEGARRPVDLPSVLRLASGRNLDVRLVRERLRQAHAEKVQAGWWALPSVRPGVRFNKVDGSVQGTEGGIVDVDKKNAFAGAGVYVDWELGEAIFEQLAATQRASASRQDLQAGLNDAALAAAEAYFDLLRAQTSLAIAEESLQLYQKLASETKAQADAGGGFRGDVLRARARYSHAVVVQRKAEASKHAAAARLREILDLPRDVELFASESQPVQLELVDASAPQHELFRQALTGRPELRSARFRARAAKAERDQTTLGPLIPRVTAGYETGAFGHTLGTTNQTENVGVGLEWKVGRGGIGDKSRQAVASARERQTRIQIRKTEQRIVREVATAQSEARSQAQAIRASQMGAQEAKEALDLYRQRQQIGVGIPLDAIFAEETFTQARLDFLDAVIGYNKAQLRLLRALGHQAR